MDRLPGCEGPRHVEAGVDIECPAVALVAGEGRGGNLDTLLLEESKDLGKSCRNPRSHLTRGCPKADHRGEAFWQLL
jgi:hypothetical protein